jgi:hypothetical protein
VYLLENVGQVWTMVLLPWVTELKRVKITGLLGTHGARAGERAAISEWRETLQVQQENVELQ